MHFGRATFWKAFFFCSPAKLAPPTIYLAPLGEFFVAPRNRFSTFDTLAGTIMAQGASGWQNLRRESRAPLRGKLYVRSSNYFIKP